MLEIRRCSVLFLEPSETVSFNLAVLLAGGDGLARQRRWRAIAPHLESPVVDLEDWMVIALGACSPSQWLASDCIEMTQDQLQRLLQMGLLIGNSEDQPMRGHRLADQRVRDGHWWPLSAAAAAAGRWSETDSAADMERNGTNTIEGLVRKLGPPVPEPLPRIDVALARTEPTAFDELLARRTTCRNFSDQVLDAATFAHLMERVFAAIHVEEPVPGLRFLKRSSPSGGGLHATDAYLLVRNVEGIRPGLYRYLTDGHALSRIDAGAGELDAIALQMVAGQHWFADAPVMVVLAATYLRSFWKYRNHAKAYRALVLDVGHLSQTLYLSATELKLGAFVTAAINEREIEKVFGLDPLVSGVIAVCGFGHRSDHMNITEFDPAARVWSTARP